MGTCTYCGVELEKNMNFCPLCGEPIPDENRDKKEYIEIRKRKQGEKQLTDYQKLTPAEKRKLFWEISIIILVSGIIVTLIIDYIIGNTISWSKYPVLVCTVLFINISLISFWHHRIFLIFSGSFVSTSILLILLDIYKGYIGWGIKLGIPLLLSTYTLLFILLLIVKHAKKRGLNIIAWSFIAAGMLSICVEGIISFYKNFRFHFEWSMIVIASVLLIATLLFFLHHRLKEEPDLKRFFHI